MSRLLCCLRARQADMGLALSHPQEGEACDGTGLPAAPPTMADVIRERKKKAGGAGLGTLRRRIANATRRPRDNRPDRGCEHARYIRSVVSSWRLAEVFLLCEELEAGAALRDLVTQAELAREPAPALHCALPALYTDRWWCDVELVGAGWALPAHRAILAARSTYFRDLLQRYPPSCARVPLEGACAAMSREEADACVYALYAGDAPAARAHCRHTGKYDGSDHTESDLDLVDNTGSCRGGACGARRGSWRRAAALLGLTRDPLHTSMRYLLDSGEMSDAKLVFRLEGGCGVAYGFRSACELPCHRAVLAARSRFFRSVMSRRPNSSNNGGAVCVDEKVLPRRFARALLHAAYTDQVDLSLIPSNKVSPSSTASSAWGGVSRGGGARPNTTQLLDDAFQLYEIARFLEMPIAVQGCEDAIVEALTPDTLPHVLRWAAAPHASQWVHRQAMRYLRDEFIAITSSTSAASIPRAALTAALASPFLQASEPAALRALLRLAAATKHKSREPGAVWQQAQSVGRRGARRPAAGAADGALRALLAPLCAHVRVEHIPRDNDTLQQLVRRGAVAPPPPPPAGEGAAHAWLGRGSNRPARCFLPYLDELRALLAEQAVPRAELARARRARDAHRIPDTLYMVAAARAEPPAGAPAAPGALAAARACVSPRAAAALRARVRELRAQPAARTAARHAPRAAAAAVRRQVALRAVREMSLPDACADLLLSDMEDDNEQSSEEAWHSPQRSSEPDAALERPWGAGEQPECARTLSGSGSLRCASAGSVRPALHVPLDNSRAGTGTRREPVRTDSAQHSSPGSWCGGGAGAGAGAGAGGAAGAGGGAARLSAAVPDVAMAPNANTHLLTARDYFRHPPPWAEYGGVVLLDLGDGATHAPRHGSRAQRNSAAAQHSTRQRDHAQLTQALCSVVSRADEEELRAAIELSVMRAYSSFRGRAASPAAPAPQPHRRAAAPATLPQPYRSDLLPVPSTSGASPRARLRRAERTERGERAERAERAELALHRPMSRVSPSPSPESRRLDRAPPPPPLHYSSRLESGSYGGGSASTSRGHSPNNYA